MKKLNSKKAFIDLKDKLGEFKDQNKKIITICSGTGCSAFGSKLVIEAFYKEIKKLQLDDKVTIRKTGCHGFCEKGPIINILPDDIFYAQVAVEDVPEIINSTIKKGKKIDRLLYTDPQTGKKYKYTHEVPFYARQKRIIFQNNGTLDPTKVEDYIKIGGYDAFVKSLFEMTPLQVIQEVKNSGLRGRGGGGFPTGLKWDFCQKAHGSPKYLICNADEGDPGAFMDRSLLEGNPHLVLEGMLIAGYAIGARYGYIYARAEYPLAIDHLKIAIKQMQELGFLGDNILGSDFSFDLKIKEGAGAFVCGEETALMASIEGKRGMPRPRPPFPAHSGLWGKPSNINNVETFANVPFIISKGANWYASIGTETSKGTKIFALAGKVNNTGLVEVPMGTTLREVIYDIGGGILKNRKFKAVQLGGPSGGCIPAHLLDTPIDYDSLIELGAMMGSGGMIIMDETTCMVDMAKYFLEFIQSESCGKCAPCRIGTKRMLEIHQRICAGMGKESDIPLLEELAYQIKATALCGLGQTAPNPVLSTLRYFRHEYEAHIRDKKCEASVCEAFFNSPCQHACPANIDIPAYIDAIIKKQYNHALTIIRKDNPFAAVCGRVCHHPCEDRCRRGQIDDPIAICSLKRYVADYDLKKINSPKINQPKITQKEKIAIIGAGPAGLSASFYLTHLGYKSTIFESLSLPGGMLQVAIPAYRLPKEILNKEIKWIMDHGIECKYGITIGKDITLPELLSVGYHAIFIAIGAHKGLNLNIEGENLKGIFSGVKLLRELNLGYQVNMGNKIVVIGGGNVAIDSARSALRKGAMEVTIIYRRSFDEMPANNEEIKDAILEGIKIKYLTSPVKIIGNGGDVSGLECMEMSLGKADKSGRRTPMPVAGSNFLIETDMVISAIGQEPIIENLLAGSTVKTTKWNTLIVDPKTLMTDHQGIFAGGDAVRGPDTVVWAIADGKKAAYSINKYLRKEKDFDDLLIPLERRRPPKIDHEPIEANREKIEHLDKAYRIKNFDEVEIGFSSRKAQKEASRCLRCDLEK